MKHNTQNNGQHNVNRNPNQEELLDPLAVLDLSIFTTCNVGAKIRHDGLHLFRELRSQAFSSVNLVSGLTIVAKLRIPSGFRHVHESTSNEFLKMIETAQSVRLFG